MAINQQQFEILKDSAIEAADTMVTELVELAGLHGWLHIQMMGIRLLASVIGNEMYTEDVDFETASEKLLNGLRKDSDQIVEEIKMGARKGFQQS